MDSKFPSCFVNFFTRITFVSYCFMGCLHVMWKGIFSFCNMVTFCTLIGCIWMNTSNMVPQCTFWMPTIIAQIAIKDITAMLISDMHLQVLISTWNILTLITLEQLWSMFRFNMHSETFFGAFIITRLAKIQCLLLMVGFCVSVQIFKKISLVITFFTRIRDSKVSTGVPPLSFSGIKLFFCIPCKRILALDCLNVQKQCVSWAYAFHQKLDRNVRKCASGPHGHAVCAFLDLTILLMCTCKIHRQVSIPDVPLPYVSSVSQF